MLVKKYGNRRLYDTEASRYITLEELADAIKRGGEPRVLDAKTNEDLTQQTLAQIIMEGRGAARLLPTPLLLQLVRLGDDGLAEFFGRYISWALELYLQTKQTALAGAGLNPFAAPSMVGSALARLLPSFGPLGGYANVPAPVAPMAAAAPLTPPPPAPTNAEVAELRREMDALKKALGHVGKSGKKKPR
jgi:polyhydroxyalkanoate synthesis repressor PhaR